MLFQFLGDRKHIFTVSNYIRDSSKVETNNDFELQMRLKTCLMK